MLMIVMVGRFWRRRWRRGGQAGALTIGRRNAGRVMVAVVVPIGATGRMGAVIEAGDHSDGHRRGDGRADRGERDTVGHTRDRGSPVTQKPHPRSTDDYSGLEQYRRDTGCLYTLGFTGVRAERYTCGSRQHPQRDCPQIHHDPSSEDRYMGTHGRGDRPAELENHE
jgi:hypothetical protein